MIFYCILLYSIENISLYSNFHLKSLAEDHIKGTVFRINVVNLRIELNQCILDMNITNITVHTQV